jgi:DNA-binding CsgD family transcriptional regulator/GAF domain-containing protein
MPDQRQPQRSGVQQTAAVSGHAARDVKLLRLAQALCSSTSADELARRVETGVPGLVHAPMQGTYFVDPGTGRLANPSRVNVSDLFLARYERLGRPVDTLLTHVMETRTAVANTSLMSPPEWLESPLYTRVKHLHGIRQVIEAPIVSDDDVVGTIHIASSDPDRAYGPEDVRLAGTVGQLVGTAVAGLRQRADLERQRDEAVAALELADTAVVVCAPGAMEPRLSDAARRLLASVAEPDESLHRLLARPRANGGWAQQLDVELVSGRPATLRARCRELTGHGGTVVTALELVGGPTEPASDVLTVLTVLTDREREVAELVGTGLTDRQIAQRLYLSRHTVSQHVKAVYRKLGITSRVELTRLLVGLR